MSVAEGIEHDADGVSAPPTGISAEAELNPVLADVAHLHGDSGGGSSDIWVGVLVAVVAVVVGAIYWVFLRRRQGSEAKASQPTAATAVSLSSSPAAIVAAARRGANRDEAPGSSPRSARSHAFVESEVSANKAVVFAATQDRAVPLRTLFEALGVELHVVDLARTAQGKHILEALREKCPASTDGQEFLFVNGVLLGGQRDVRNLLLTGERTAFGTECNWEKVLVDAKNEWGFMVLSAQNGFQHVGDVGEDPAVMATLESKPLHTVAELHGFDITTMTRSPVPMALRARDQARRSKLLICHDMKGGYLEDRFKQGSTELDAYRFYQWDLADLFVYFGHALVCPPPVGWISAGHCHGTRVLGTFLTEGERGTELCKELFKDVHSAETNAAKLAAIAWHGGFDGWLINVENDVPEELVPHLDSFLCTLRRGMQVQNPLAQVIWYGSLSRSGKRKSHARLDDASADFFQYVDGFYADYGWKTDDAMFSAAYNLDRRYDVFMGIDVFGRHDTPGGGKMNCAQPLRSAWNAGVSAALFAPGWTHECYRHEQKEDFVVAEVLHELWLGERFWKAVRTSWKVKSPCYDSLGGRNCLYTSFNTGHGVGTWADGKHVSSAAWFNMAFMDMQPVHSLHAGDSAGTATGSVTAVISNDVAFQGGTSVKLQGQLVGREKVYFKLLDVDVEFSPRRIMEISYTTAARDGSVCLLLLTVCPGLGRPTHHMILRSADDPSTESAELRTDSQKALSPVAKASLEKHFFLPVITKFYGFEAVATDAKRNISTEGWCKKTYRLGGQLWDQKHIVEVGVLCTKKLKAPGDREDYLAFVGEVCVVGSSGEKGLKTAVRSVHREPKWCEKAKVTSFKRLDAGSVAFELRWDLTRGGTPVRYVLVFARSGSGERIFLGKTFDQSFFARSCPWERATSASSAMSTRLTIELQSVSWSGQSSTAPNGMCLLHLEE